MLNAADVKYDKEKVACLSDLILDGKLSEYERTKEQCIAYFEEIINNTPLPDFKNLEAKMLDILFDRFSDYPEPSEYIERIVNRLSKPNDKWEEDSLRLRILKQFIKYGNCLVYQTDSGKDKSVYGWEKIILTYAKKKAGKKLSSPSEAVAFVDEGIFAEYDKAVKVLQKEIHDIQCAESLISCRKKVQELKRQIKTLKKADESDERNAEIANIERQLKETQTNLKEEEKPLNNAKSKLKKERKKYGIIRLADDLSSGKFRSAGVTKRDLYLFAIVFDMTYYCPNKKEDSDMILKNDSDIEKNLFEDYYTNNLMRFTTEAYLKNRCALELDPSGQGINYKNFAEMVFIYYISKDYSPIEKICRIYEMIERLENDDRGNSQSNSFGTNFYRSIFTEDILELSETDFENFIKTYYDCSLTDINGKKLNKTEFQIKTNQDTAFELYREIIEAIRNLEESDLRESCNYGLWITDISMLKKSGNTNLTKYIKGDAETIEKFINLLKGINSFMGIEFEEKESAQNILSEKKEPSIRIHRMMDIQDPEEITRTSLIVAYYYFYNARNIKLGNVKSYLEVYKDYTNDITGLNAILLKAHMQPISERNIFDLVVIFSSYAYLVN